MRRNILKREQGLIFQHTLNLHVYKNILSFPKYHNVKIIISMTLDDIFIIYDIIFFLFYESDSKIYQKFLLRTNFRLGNKNNKILSHAQRETLVCKNKKMRMRGRIFQNEFCRKNNRNIQTFISNG